MLGRVAVIAAVFTLGAAPTAGAATADTATAEASPGPYLVGEPITFTSTTPCTAPCRLSWRYLNGTRLGEQLGEGVSVARAFSTPGLKTVQLRLTELCVGTSRLTCASFAYVSVPVKAPPDATAPTFALSGLTTEATGASTSVNYTFAASDPDDAVVSQSCTPAPGSSFPVGTTPVDCTATDSHGNVGTESFAVVVSDTTAPTLTVPETVTTEATSPAGAAVDFEASATDGVDGTLAPTCSEPSGTTFPLGATTVDCTVSDSHQNSSSASFVVDVVDTTAPTLTMPEPMTVEATSPDGAAVTYTATADDLVDGRVTPDCSPRAGTTFPLGPTTVDCTATDAHNNGTSATFVVDVVDTAPPTLTVPDRILVAATSPAGAAVAFAVTAADLVDGPTETSCSQASDSTFPVGTTSVDCTAADSKGNTASAHFDIVVENAEGTTPPTPADTAPTAT